jgi:signal transduction histidine kinase
VPIVTQRSVTQATGGRIVTSILLAPVRPAGWRATAHLAAGLPLAAVGFAVVALFGGLTVALAPTVVPALGTLVALAWCTDALASAQQSRFGVLLGAEVALAEPVESAPDVGWFRRLFDRALSGRTGRQVSYHLLALPVSVAGTVVAITMWTVGIGLTLTLTYAWALPDRPEWYEQLVLTAGGLATLFAAPWLAPAMSTVDTWLARRLLGPPRRLVLEQRVETLTASRAGAIDSADAERRRIERDLHDGTQQRLTALAMNLGMAKESFDPDDPAAKVIAAAHEDAKQTLAELRSFVRGLHPAVLHDRGLDAALSGLASRSPVPVRLQVSIDRRPSATVESVAYFVVSEALTNVTKHAAATAVEVTAERVREMLVVTIVDNGRGGAIDDGTGTGLRGLRQRVAAVDGRLHIDSPPAGGTTITAELPCES